jgi:2'-5' RNA ligase
MILSFRKDIEKMHGVVSLLDSKHYRIVEELWAELEREFAVRGVYVTPYPHFSYQVASQYDEEQLERILQRIADKSSPFQVKTTGLGIFTGPKSVIYIPVVRNLELTQFHLSYWSEISSAGSGIQEYYHPDQWMPHITIGFGDIHRENVASIVGFLSERNLNWNITIDNIAFICDTGTNQELKFRYDFKG